MGHLEHHHSVLQQIVIQLHVVDLGRGSLWDLVDSLGYYSSGGAPYSVLFVLSFGCDPNADNYDSTATIDDGFVYMDA